MAFTLRPDWYSHNIAEGFDLAAPGIYEWRIEGVGVYVGKALKLRSRIGDYPNNVRRMLQGLPWHGNPKRKYRDIHKALRRAYERGATVTVTVLENCGREERAEREQVWIRRRREEARAGGLPVLNAD